MMKWYGAILLMCLVLPLWGQVHRGDWMLGGNASFDISKKIGNSEADFVFQAYPKIGYFLTDRIALTMGLSTWAFYYPYEPDLVDGKNRYWKYKNSIGPGISWYPGGKKSPFQPFVYLSPTIPIVFLSTKPLDEFYRINVVEYNAGLGLQYFVRKEVALDFRFNRYHPKLRSEGFTSLLFGVQVFLAKNEKQKTKKAKK